MLHNFTKRWGWWPWHYEQTKAYEPFHKWKSLHSTLRYLGSGVTGQTNHRRRLQGHLIRKGVWSFLPFLCFRGGACICIGGWVHRCIWKGWEIVLREWIISSGGTISTSGTGDMGRDVVMLYCNILRDANRCDILILVPRVWLSWHMFVS
jgi:hypothetical protein